MGRRGIERASRMPACRYPGPTVARRPHRTGTGVALGRRCVETTRWLLPEIRAFRSSEQARDQPIDRGAHEGLAVVDGRDLVALVRDEQVVHRNPASARSSETCSASSTGTFESFGAVDHEQGRAQRVEPVNGRERAQERAVVHRMTIFRLRRLAIHGSVFS